MKLSKTSVIAIVVSMLLLVGGAYFDVFAQSKGHFEKLVIHSRGKLQHSFDVEIARTPMELEIGLMFREHMDPDQGMLFELGHEGVTKFWMKNTLIPLDMLFIAADGTIKTIHENAVPQSLDSISSEVPVMAVLEINGGRSRALGIAVGDRVIHSYFR